MDTVSGASGSTHYKPDTSSGKQHMVETVAGVAVPLTVSCCQAVPPCRARREWLRSPAVPSGAQRCPEVPGSAQQ